MSDTTDTISLTRVANGWVIQPAGRTEATHVATTPADLAGHVLRWAKGQLSPRDAAQDAMLDQIAAAWLRARPPKNDASNGMLGEIARAWVEAFEGYDFDREASSTDNPGRPIGGKSG